MIPPRVLCSFSPHDLLMDIGFAIAKSMGRKVNILIQCLRNPDFHAKHWHLYVDPRQQHEMEGIAVTGFLQQHPCGKFMWSTWAAISRDSFWPAEAKAWRNLSQRVTWVSETSGWLHRCWKSICARWAPSPAADTFCEGLPTLHP